MPLSHFPGNTDLLTGRCSDRPPRADSIPPTGVVDWLSANSLSFLCLYSLFQSLEYHLILLSTISDPYSLAVEYYSDKPPNVFMLTISGRLKLQHTIRKEIAGNVKDFLQIGLQVLA